MRIDTFRAGFTLVEVLVMVAIVAVLATIVLFNIQGVGAKSRDTQRISDLSQIQLALRVYKDVHSGYPDSNLNQEQINATLGSYLSGAITDPRSGTSGFGYAFTADSSACGNRAILYAIQMETTQHANWLSQCGGDSPGTNTHVIILR